MPESRGARHANSEPAPGPEIQRLDALVGRSRSEGHIDLTGMGDDELTRLRRDRIGFVFLAFDLIPTLTVLEQPAVRPWRGATAGSRSAASTG